MLESGPPLPAAAGVAAKRWMAPHQYDALMDEPESATVEFSRASGDEVIVASHYLLILATKRGSLNAHAGKYLVHRESLCGVFPGAAVVPKSGGPPAQGLSSGWRPTWVAVATPSLRQRAAGRLCSARRRSARSNTTSLGGTPPRNAAKLPAPQVTMAAWIESS